VIRIIGGDCREVVRTLPDESVHCVVTSPPYWGLRDYGIAGQLGMEGSLGEYVAVMVEVFREVRRVLRKDGTLWLNLGDSYVTSPPGRGPTPGCSTLSGIDSAKYQVTLASGHSTHRGTLSAKLDGLKTKDLCGIPWRVAFALQADGWYLRQDIIWSKPNPMPESVTDRCTKAHEYLFLLAKSERYYYEADAIAEKSKDWSKDGPSTWARNTAEQYGTGRGNGGLANIAARYKTNEHPLTRNRRSVWEVASAPFSEAHFATFPPALIEPCILAGCPKGGTVLDPFGGAGTTGLVADRLERNAVLIELNPQYADMAEFRVQNDAPLFVETSRALAS
jgi:DNA modification methylase